MCGHLCVVVMACTVFGAFYRYVLKRMRVKQSPCGTPMLVLISLLIFFPTFTMKYNIFYLEFNYVQLIRVHNFFQNIVVNLVNSFGHV